MFTHIQGRKTIPYLWTPWVYQSWYWLDLFYMLGKLLCISCWMYWPQFLCAFYLDCIYWGLFIWLLLDRTQCLIQFHLLAAIYSAICVLAQLHRYLLLMDLRQQILNRNVLYAERYAIRYEIYTTCCPTIWLFATRCEIYTTRFPKTWLFANRSVKHGRVFILIWFC